MQEVFEKIIERLKTLSDYEPIEYDCNDTACVDEQRFIATDDAIEIVKQEAEKFGTDTNVGSNGWIPCSERLPEESLNDVIGWDAYRERCCFVHYIGGRFILGDDTESVKITHWMPTPYQPNGE